MPRRTGCGGFARALGVALQLVLASSAATPHAAAQAREPDPPPQYHTLIESALVESAASRWPEALALFRQAHAVYPNARTHRGIGMVAYELRDYVEASRNLALSLRSERRPLDTAQRAEVTRLLERTRAFVGRYELGALPRDTTLDVDGKPAEREADGTLVLALGAHRVQAHTAAPEQNGSAELQVKGGEHEPLPLVLQAVAAVTPAPAAAPAAAPVPNTSAAPQASPAAAPPAPSAPTPGPTAATTTPKSDRDDSSNTVPIVLTATGGAMLVAGAVLLVVGMGDFNTVDAAADGTPWQDLEAANDRAPILTGLGSGLLGAGGALALSGGVLWLTGSGHADADADGSLDGLSLRMRGCF